MVALAASSTPEAELLDRLQQVVVLDALLLRGGLGGLFGLTLLLVPGVGAQGGSLSEVCQYGMNANVGLLINSSRAIIYASNGTDFAEKAREEALKMQEEMEGILQISIK